MKSRHKGLILSVDWFKNRHISEYISNLTPEELRAIIGGTFDVSKLLAKYPTLLRKLELLGATKLQAFLADFGSGKFSVAQLEDLFRRMEANVHMVEAWDIVKRNITLQDGKTSKLALDLGNLEAIARMIQEQEDVFTKLLIVKPDGLGFLNGKNTNQERLEALIQYYKSVPCATCAADGTSNIGTNPLPTIDQIWENLKFGILLNEKNVPGGSGIISGNAFFSPNLGAIYGANHELSYLRKVAQEREMSYEAFMVLLKFLWKARMGFNLNSLKRSSG